MILESLPDNFNLYKNNYYIMGKELTITQLILKLESIEKSLRKPDSTHHAKSSSKPQENLKVNTRIRERQRYQLPRPLL